MNKPCKRIDCWWTSEGEESGCVKYHMSSISLMNCRLFTSTETVSIPASELAEHEARKETMLNLSRKLTELRAEVAELKKDRELLDFVDNINNEVLQLLPLLQQGQNAVLAFANPRKKPVFGLSIRGVIREAISRAIKEEGKG
jgi:hypothetical protein